MNAHWSAPLVGLPYSIGGRGPDSFDCWGLLWHVYRTQLGIELEQYNHLNITRKVEFGREVKRCIAGGEWLRLDKPVDLCAVGLAFNKDILHVGVWLEIDGGVVLHSRQHAGITIQDRRGLSLIGINKVVFYQHKDHVIHNR